MPDIRPARPEDADEIARVLTASITELCAADHGNDPTILARWTANKTSETVTRWIADPACDVVVAIRDNAIAGVGAISCEGEVLLNYVSPAHRHAGVSRALIAHLEAEAKVQGLSTLRLTSTTTALDFYRACGWQESGPPVDDYGMPGYPMVKFLVLD